MLAVAILAAAIVSTLTDRSRARPLARSAEREALATSEAAGAHRLAVGIHLLRGHVVVEDFSHRRAGEPATARSSPRSGCRSSLDWSTASRAGREFIVTSVELTDWQMLVEKWSRRPQLPEVHARTRRAAAGEARAGSPTTLQYLRASRGQFTYEDHEMPWSVVAPNIDVNISNLPSYHGTATFTRRHGRDPGYVPMWANMKARFAHRRQPRCAWTRIDLETDGAQTVGGRRSSTLARWPEQTLRREVARALPAHARDLLQRARPWALTGDGDFTGTFHLFKGGHDLTGTFPSAVAGVNAYRFPHAARLAALDAASAFEVTDAGVGALRRRRARSRSRSSRSGRRRGRRRASTRRTRTSISRSSRTSTSCRGSRFAGRASGANVLEWPHRALPRAPRRAAHVDRRRRRPASRR